MPFPIARLRRLSRANMPEAVEVLRDVRQEDGEDGFVTEPSVVAAHPGRYRTAGARELQIASQTGQSVEGVITVPYDAEILPTDTLRRQGGEYRVSGVLDGTEELSAHLEVLVRRA